MILSTLSSQPRLVKLSSSSSSDDYSLSSIDYFPPDHTLLILGLALMAQNNTSIGTSLVDLASLSNSTAPHSPTPSLERSNNSLAYEDEDVEVEDDIVLAKLDEGVDATGPESEDAAAGEEEERDAGDQEESVAEEEQDEEIEVEEDEDDLIVEPPLEEGSARDDSAAELEDEQPEDVEDDEPMQASEEEEEEEDEELDEEDASEREAIQYEMQNLLETVPILNGQYKLTDRLGEGVLSPFLSPRDADDATQAPSPPSTRRSTSSTRTTTTSSGRLLPPSSLSIPTLATSTPKQRMRRLKRCSSSSSRRTARSLSRSSASTSRAALFGSSTSSTSSMTFGAFPWRVLRVERS